MGEREREERRERGEREKGIDEITGEITMEEETLEWNAHIISMEYPVVESVYPPCVWLLSVRGTVYEVPLVLEYRGIH